MRIKENASEKKKYCLSGIALDKTHGKSPECFADARTDLENAGRKIFSHLTCNTREELRYNLHLLCKRNYGILYFAFHGSPGKIHLHRDKVSLTELAEMMNCRFENWIIHFGTCSTFRKPREVAYFAEQTRVALVTGFTRDVDWIESCAFELLLVQSVSHISKPENNLPSSDE